MSRVNIGWAVVIALGIGSFVLARDVVQQQRFERMKIRQQITDDVKMEVMNREKK